MKSKKKLTTLIVIGTLIVLLSGFSFAYYMRREVQGNVDNKIVLTTLDYGQITVTYEAGNNTFSASNVDLPQDEAGQDKMYMIKFNINSTSNASQEVQVRWNNLNNTFCQYRNNDYQCDDPATSGTFVGNDLVYQLYKCTLSQYTNITTADDADISSCSKISATTDEAVPLSGSIDFLHNTETITLPASSTTYYVVRVILKNLNSNQRYNMGDTFSGDINVTFPVWLLADEIEEAHPPVSDAIASTYVTSATGVNFDDISSPTNGQGLYINNKVNIASDPTTGLVKYFRGGTFCAYTGYASETLGAQCTAAGGTWSKSTCSYNLSQSTCEGAGFTWYELKNNVKFADKYWKIIRIDEDGNIRLLYNGNATTATEEDTQYGGFTAFNNVINDAAYVGYMIPNFTGNTTSVEEATRNDKDSTIKGVVEDFYDEVLIGYEDEIADAGYCGDRSITSGPGFGAGTTETTYYGAHTRLTTNKTPTYSCSSSNDLYTMSTSLVGNKELTKSIGLVTADELIYAGGKYAINNYTYYMQNGYYYWTMSPFGSHPNNNGLSSVGFVNTLGDILYNDVSLGFGVRPSVSLKPDVIVSGGAGTLEDPWIVAS